MPISQTKLTLFKLQSKTNQQIHRQGLLTGVQDLAKQCGAIKWVMAHLVRVDLLQVGGVACQHFNPEPGDWVQIAAGIALNTQLSQLDQLLQRL